ncbi:MAG TPA: histidine phosphatase family protein [Bryobacteraceae bacterium]|nr:histidine phosphatase family protein [Bryobacteraceae bacterium]
MRLPILAIILVFTLAAPSSAATIILVRHAERAAAMTADAPLTPRGEERARQLAAMLRDANIRAVFTTEVRRTQQTAGPTAQEFHLRPSIIPQKETNALLARLKALPEGEAVLVVGHADTVPAIVQRLGGPLVPMKDDEYDRMVIVTTGGAKPSIITLRYGDR